MCALVEMGKRQKSTDWIITQRAAWARQQTKLHWQPLASATGDWWTGWCDWHSILMHCQTSSQRLICTTRWSENWQYTIIIISSNSTMIIWHKSLQKVKKSSQRPQTYANTMLIFPLCLTGGSTIFRKCFPFVAMVNNPFILYCIQMRIQIITDI